MNWSSESNRWEITGSTYTVICIICKPGKEPKEFHKKLTDCLEAYNLEQRLKRKRYNKDVHILQNFLTNTFEGLM